MMGMTYEYIWREVVYPNIRQLLKEISASDIEKFEITVLNEEILKKNVFSNYEKKKNRLKEIYHFDNGENDRRIDIHKIAACFASVLIEDKVFKFSIKEGLTDDIFLLNAKLAYNVSLDILLMSLVAYYIECGNEDIASKILEKGCLYVPSTSKGHDEYNVGRQKTIALNDVFENEFDVLTYSDMMFWIEYYNRQKYEKKIDVIF